MNAEIKWLFWNKNLFIVLLYVIQRIRVQKWKKKFFFFEFTWRCKRKSVINLTVLHIKIKILEIQRGHTDSCVDEFQMFAQHTCSIYDCITHSMDMCVSVFAVLSSMACSVRWTVRRIRVNYVTTSWPTAKNTLTKNLQGRRYAYTWSFHELYPYTCMFMHIDGYVIWHILILSYHTIYVIYIYNHILLWICVCMHAHIHFCVMCMFCVHIYLLGT